jgi:hypothetical protein
VNDPPETAYREAHPPPRDAPWNPRALRAFSLAAIVAWGIKREFLCSRPITMIRHMSARGQSSDPRLPSYHVEGMPLEDGLIELITEETTQPGQRHARLAPFVGEIAVLGWRGEPGSRDTQLGGITWIRGRDWITYQRRNFVTPAFPGFVSGHSTFSRAAAEIMTSITGNAYFPGGIGSFTANANAYLVFEQGPSQTTTLEWATYYDAADLAGNSRRWGGIHVREDDYKSRIIGAQSGKQVWTLAKKYFDGSILSENVTPTQACQPNGSVVLTSRARRGLYYQWEYSTDLQTWTPLTSSARTTESTITYTDIPPPGQPRFYRARWTAGAQ